jgi:hypothetical protein
MAKELLKEAIADAKAVREVALENAKMALEEAFDSKIKNMLSAKLAEEIEEDLELEETYMEDEKDEDMKEAYHEDEKDEDMKEGSYDEDEKDEDMKEEFDLEEDEEINLDELMAELEEMGNLEEGKDDEKDEDMKEGKHDEKDEDMKEGKDDEKDEDMKEGQVNELAGLATVASIIAAAGGIEAILSKGRAGKLSGKMESVYKALEGMAAGAGAARRSEGVKDLDENFDIDALISEIEADLNEETVDEGATGYDEKVGGKGRTGYDEKVGGKGRTGYDGAVKKLKEERDEALETVESLKNTISEMNLLNSKLLYCNKLFRANALTEAQKVKVVDALDKSTTTGEAKLVFETLQESFAFTGVEKRAIKEGLGRASKATGNAPTKVITESVNDTVSRFQKLANINK